MNDGLAPTAHQSDIVDQARRLIRNAREASEPRSGPFVTLTYAQSVDGCIARKGGETLQLSNPLAQRMTHQIRASHAAILVGINTVIRDDPQLTVRLVSGENPQPVVVDSQLRFPREAALLRDSCVRPIIVCSQQASSVREQQLSDLGARVVRVSSTSDDRLDLAETFCQLGAMGYTSLMVEGGASIITSVLRQRLAHQLLLTISPRFVGGLRAVNVAASETDGSPPARDALPRLCNIHYQWLAGDLLLRADFASERHDADYSGMTSRQGEGNDRK